MQTSKDGGPRGYPVSAGTSMNVCIYINTQMLSHALTHTHKHKYTHAC